ncbi:MAG: ATP-binding cassette domain-containing protein [Gammaproteobacteria bacterium]|nr:ATP-binding cassette domain-containing protein [Gammaproteobacteria bacterium]
MNSEEIAIRVEKVAKRFRLGLEDAMHDTFGAAMLDFIKSPLKNYRYYRSLHKFDDSAGPDDPSSEPSDILWALRSVSFEVKRGEVLGIIGTNGAGKSTLLKILSRITPPTRGSIEIRGRVSSLLEVGTGFHNELTGRENIYLNGTVLGMRKKEIDRKFDEIVEFSGVERFLDTPVKRYSSGMRVRLAFSVAAHLEPEILIIDEVLAVGDAAFQKKCMNKMQDVGEGGRTVLFVSHSMPAITRLCHRAILLNQGTVLKDGLTHDVVSAYLGSGQGSPSHKQWDDPGTAPAGKVARLLAVRALDADRKISSAMKITQPIAIEIEFEVIEPGYILMPHFHVFNDEGVRLFAALDQDPQWRGKQRPKGRYICRGWIPANLLSEGLLYVSPALTTLQPDIPQFIARDAISFQVMDSRHEGAESARGDYARNIKGVIRPMLSWESEIVEIPGRRSTA